jgi:hypothetical protein
MTPKEKAEHLVMKYYNTYIINKSSLIMRRKEEEAKKCALIAVDEIIEQWFYIDTYIGDMNGELNPNLRYWHKVKKEIEKL